MGGLGSGIGFRFLRFRTKEMTEQLPSLDISDLFRRRKASGSHVFHWLNEIRIDVSEDRISLTNLTCDSYLAVSFVLVSATPCYYGGVRRWFVCPLCKKKARRLYLRGLELACRRCHHLAYPSQNETLAYRLLRRRDKLAARLLPNGARPKWMHRFTHWCICDQQRELGDLSTFAFVTGAKCKAALSALLGNSAGFNQAVRRRFPRLSGQI